MRRAASFDVVHESNSTVLQQSLLDQFRELSYSQQYDHLFAEELDTKKVRVLSSVAAIPVVIGIGCSNSRKTNSIAGGAQAEQGGADAGAAWPARAAVRRGRDGQAQPVPGALLGQNGRDVCGLHGRHSRPLPPGAGHLLLADGRAVCGDLPHHGLLGHHGLLPPPAQPPQLPDAQMAGISARVLRRPGRPGAPPFALSFQKNAVYGRPFEHKVEHCIIS